MAANRLSTFAPVDIQPERVESSRQSKTAPSFLSLPPEIRIKIYKYLLLANDNIEPQHDSYLASRRARREWESTNPNGALVNSPRQIAKRKRPYLYSAILRISRTTYNEASAVLYEENTFQYRCDANFFGKPIPVPLRSCTPNLKRIKHIAINLFQEQCYLTAKCICAVLEGIEMLGCSLRTLRLNFYFIYREGQDQWLNFSTRQIHPNRRRLEPMSRRTFRSSLVKSLAALSVRQEIQIHLCVCAPLLEQLTAQEDAEEFQRLADDTVAKIGWESNRTEPELSENGMDWPFGGVRKRYEGYRAFWEWQLHP